jgi:hypothetical protein
LIFLGSPGRRAGAALLTPVPDTTAGGAIWVADPWHQPAYGYAPRGMSLLAGRLTLDL